MKDKSTLKGNIHQGTIEFSNKDENPSNMCFMKTLKRAGRKRTDDPKKREERVKRLKEVQERLKQAGYNPASENETIEQLENEPAYMRKKIQHKT